MFNAKQLYLWILLAVQDHKSIRETSPQMVCAHLIAFTEVLHSFKSLVFVSRVFRSIHGGGRSASAVLWMAVCFAVALALFLAALHFKSVRDEEYAFVGETRPCAGRAASTTLASATSMPVPAPTRPGWRAGATPAAPTHHEGMSGPRALSLRLQLRKMPGTKPRP